MFILALRDHFAVQPTQIPDIAKIVLFESQKSLMRSEMTFINQIRPVRHSPVLVLNLL